jgi:hypothetical protein
MRGNGSAKRAAAWGESHGVETMSEPKTRPR